MLTTDERRVLAEMCKESLEFIGHDIITGYNSANQAVHWRPDESIEQAFMVLQFMYDKGWHYRIVHDQDDSGIVEVFKMLTNHHTINDGHAYFKSISELANAISHAACAALALKGEGG